METAIIQIKKLFFLLLIYHFPRLRPTAALRHVGIMRRVHLLNAGDQVVRCRHIGASEAPGSPYPCNSEVCVWFFDAAMSLICIMSLSMADNWAQRQLVSMKAPVLFWQKPEKKSSPEKAALCRGGKWSRTPAVFISCNWSVIQLLCNSCHGSHITTSMSWN